jgi:peroxiredoxin
MSEKLKPGQTVPKFSANDIHRKEVRFPEPQGRVTHLQFRRFAGCPICNLHLQSFVQRIAEVEKAGIREVVVYHSSDEQLLPYQGNFPFQVIGDPSKSLYKKFGVGSSLASVLNPGSWGASVKGMIAKDKPSIGFPPKGGPLGLPADFLIAADGRLIATHYGRHADDQWTVDEVLSTAQSAR